MEIVQVCISLSLISFHIETAFCDLSSVGMRGHICPVLPVLEEVWGLIWVPVLASFRQIRDPGVDFPCPSFLQQLKDGLWIVWWDWLIFWATQTSRAQVVLHMGARAQGAGEGLDPLVQWWHRAGFGVYFCHGTTALLSLPFSVSLHPSPASLSWFLNHKVSGVVFALARVVVTCGILTPAGGGVLVCYQNTNYKNTKMVSKENLNAYPQSYCVCL